PLSKPLSFPQVARLAGFAVAVALLGRACYFASYQPSAVICLPGLHPLAVQTDGSVLIAGTTGEGHVDLLSPQVVGPLRFVSLATGNDAQPPLPLEQTDETRGTTISEAKLSSDGKLLLVVRTQPGLAIQKHYFVTVFDLAE